MHVHWQSYKIASYCSLSRIIHPQVYSGQPYPKGPKIRAWHTEHCVRMRLLLTKSGYSASYTCTHTHSLSSPCTHVHDSVDSHLQKHSSGRALAHISGGKRSTCTGRGAAGPVSRGRGRGQPKETSQRDCGVGRRGGEEGMWWVANQFTDTEHKNTHIN